MSIEDEPTANAEGETAPETEVVETEGQETPAEEQASEQEEQPKPEKKDRLQLRFSDLTKQRDEERQEKEYWRQEALRNQPREQTAQPQANAAPDPSHNTYGDADPAYTQAVIDHTVSLRVAEAVTKQRELATKEATERDQQTKITTLRDKLFESGLEGAIAIASGGPIPVSEAMVEALAVSENAPMVADYLGKNPAEAARIANLPTSVQGYELARLEARLAVQPKPTTQAKPPPATLSGNRGAATTGLRDDMPIEDWMKANAAGIR